MILDGLWTLVLAGTVAFGLWGSMYDVALLCGALTIAFGVCWWLDYGDRLT